MGLLNQINLEFIQEKLFSFPLAIAILIILPPLAVGDAYLILGHAHFMMSALYQYKMGRITNWGIVAYLGIFAALFFIAYQIPKAFTLFVAICLLFHVYHGEVRHIKKTYSLPYLLITLGMGALIGPWLAMELWPFNLKGLWSLNLNPLIPLLSSATLVVLASFFFIREQGKELELLFITLILVYILFCTLELLGMRPSGTQSFGLIVISHYLATYFNVYRSFTRKGQGKQWVFIWESLGMNLLFLIGYVVIFSYAGKQNVVYDYVYHPISFYVWTLMHFITTIDFNKYKLILMQNLPKEKVV